jgi:RNA polymerase sigma-70 factor (ECF subfamily)
MTAGEVTYLRQVDHDRSGISDEALVQGCARGDQTALAALFSRYYPTVYRFLSRLSGCDDQDLDDLVQNTFLEIQRGSSRFAGRSSVKSWIFGVAANVAKNHVRSESRRKNAIRALGELPPGSEQTPLDRVERHEILLRMGAALRGLPYRLRVVFVMCALEDIPGVEAARILGLRQGTLWRRLHEARKKLGCAIERRHA